MSEWSIREAREFLTRARIFFEDDPKEGEPLELNLNDTWAWGDSDGEEIPDAELPRLATLFCRYGSCGMLYWVSERRGGQCSVFCDNQRFIDFVRAEEKIREEEPDDNRRGYLQREYRIGGAS